MRKTVSVILILAIVFLFASCNIGDIAGSTAETTDPLKAADSETASGTVKLENEEKEYALSESDAGKIFAIFEACSFIEEPKPDTAADYEINMGTNRYLYHSGTGTLLFNDNHCFLSEADTAALNEILFKYVQPNNK